MRDGSVLIAAAVIALLLFASFDFVNARGCIFLRDVLELCFCCYSRWKGTRRERREGRDEKGVSKGTKEENKMK
jgi:hypothetical protein